MNFNKNIQNLRKKKKITQQQLADFIGVTKTSVSKWETGTTLPDIEIILQLATYFDITVDELLGYEPQLNKEQIKIYYHEFAEKFTNKPFEEVIKEVQALVRKYYSCYTFLEQMTILLLNHINLAEDKNRINELYLYDLELCNHILECCRDVNINSNVITIKSMINLQIGNIQEVVEILEPKFSINNIGNREFMLPMAYLMMGENEKSEMASQIGIFRGILDLFSYAIYLLSAKQDDKNYVLKIIERFDCIEDKFNLINLNPNLDGIYNYNVAVSLMKFLEKDDTNSEEIIYQRIDKYVLAVKKLFASGLNCHGDEFFSKLGEWFNDISLGSIAVRNEKLVKESALEGLTCGVFDKLHDRDKLNSYICQIQNIIIDKRKRG